MEGKCRRFMPALVTLAVLCLAAHAPAQKYSEWSWPVNLGPMVNSPESDFGPAISKNGLSLFISSNRPGGFGGYDLWVSQRASLDAQWGAPVNLGSTINTGSDEYIPSFSRDGHWMFFSSNRGGGFGSFDIWASWRTHTKDDFGWQPPVNLGAGVNSGSFDAAPHYFENDDMGVPLLFFSRWAYPTDLDTYVSALACDGLFCPAVLVPELNSPQRDARPNLRHDGRELFFYSNRPGVVGGTLEDLWTSTRDTTLDPWSAPVNLGSPVNSESKELHPAVSSDNLTLFFASDRPGGSGDFDLYMTVRTKRRGL